MTMKQHRGVGIGQGIVSGPVARMDPPLPTPADTPSTRTRQEEAVRVQVAIAAVAGELRARSELVRGTAAEVLEAQVMMADDPSLHEVIEGLLAQGKTAERAVFDAFGTFRDMISTLGGYLAERAEDLDDVAIRVVAQLSGAVLSGVPNPGHPYILVATTLAPADTAMLDLDKVLGIITVEGGPTSHTAILAREMSLPTVVGVRDAMALADGGTVILDAASGTVLAEPSEEESAGASARQAAREAVAAAPITPGMLRDGTPIPLLANLGSTDGAAQALALGAEGVGLFRTEFLFLDAEAAPSVAEQQKSYEALLRPFAGKKVVVRVLDAGADKPLAFLNDSNEENPALGLRGLRALRVREWILRDQLTALAAANAATRASNEGADLWVMAPMVTTAEEARYFSGLVKKHGLATAGVMVEVPSAAILADFVLQEADFASIGTNDLTQYTFAADRLLGSVASFQNPWHPAILRLIREVGTAGRAHGKPVGICGEAAADPLLALVLVGLGATSLSMASAAFADVRAQMLLHDFESCAYIAEEALATADAAAARAAASDAAMQVVLDAARG